MSARLYRLGNIYSRIEGLIRKNHLPESNKPLWLDVYKQFPPKLDPNYNRLEPEIPVKEILYKEDALRAKIHKAFHDRLGVLDLNSDSESVSQNLLKTCQQFVSEGMSENEAIEKLRSIQKNEATEKLNFFQKTVKKSKKTESEIKSNVEM